MTVKHNPNRSKTGDIVGGGGFRSVGGGGAKGSIITGRKSTISKKKTRDWSDVKLSDRREGLAEKFLESHNYQYSSTSGKPNTYTYDGDKIKAYSGSIKGGKSGVSVKTFNNPTLKSLRDWMGY